MLNNPGTSGGRFAFLDAGETARRLQIDRTTLDQWVRGAGTADPGRLVQR